MFSNNIIAAKTVAILILGLTSFTGGVLPVLLAKCFEKYKYSGNSGFFEKLLCLLMYFGGGVLICTTFIHLLPEVRENVDTYIENKHIELPMEIPFAELMMCLGFFIMYTIEESVHHFLKKISNKQTNDKGIENPMYQDGRISSLSMDQVSTIFTNEEAFIHTVAKTYQSCEDAHNHGHAIHLQESKGSSFLIVLALSIHELFEGMAIGFEKEVAYIMYLLVAVACHKAVLSMCLGIQLVATRIELKIAYLYVVCFALTSPCGIGIGIFLSSQQTDAIMLLSIILQGLVTGTLLYVVFFEILRETKTSKFINSFAKIIFLLFGFISMLALQLLLDSGHQHSHGEVHNHEDQHDHHHHHNHNDHDH